MEEEQQQAARDFFLSSLDRALDTYGSAVRTVVYYELKKSFGVAREDIPLKPDILEKTIDKIFGLGGEAVKRVILRELEVSSGIKDLAKQELVTAIRTAYHSRLV